MGNLAGMNLKAKVLKGRHVRLEPMTAELRDELRGAIDCDPDAWEILFARPLRETVEA